MSQRAQFLSEWIWQRTSAPRWQAAACCGPIARGIDCQVGLRARACVRSAVVSGLAEPAPGRKADAASPMTRSIDCQVGVRACARAERGGERVRRARAEA